MADPQSHVKLIFDEAELTDREKAIAQFFARWARQLPEGKAFEFAAEFIVLMRVLEEGK